MGITYLFDSAKALEVATWLLSKSNGHMDKLKLVKLLYFIERESLDRFLRPIFGGRYVSMPHGTVPSEALDALNGEVGNWDHVVTVTGKDVFLRDPRAPFTAQLLSRNQLQVLEDVFAKLGHLSSSALRNKTHDLPEYRDPDGSSLPIRVDTILRALGKRDEDITEAEELAETRNLVVELFDQS